MQEETSSTAGTNLNPIELVKPQSEIVPSGPYGLTRERPDAFLAGPQDQLVKSLMIGFYWERMGALIAEHMWMGLRGKDTDALARMIMECGDGDYCEIGVGHGGSLIMAAKIRELFGIEGKLYGVDPFDPAYCRQPHWECTIEDCYANLEKFGVEATLVKSASYPWPLPDNEFVCAMVDGDKFNNMPQLDYLSLKDRTTKQIMFHNARYSDVLEAISWAKMDGWRLNLKIGKSVVLRREVAGRVPYEPLGQELHHVVESELLLGGTEDPLVPLLTEGTDE